MKKYIKQLILIFFLLTVTYSLHREVSNLDVDDKITTTTLNENNNEKPKEGEGKSDITCTMIYGDNVETFSGEKIDLSFDAGKGLNAQDALDKTLSNWPKIDMEYKKNMGELTVNFATDWDERVFMKHRTSAEGYERNGWYTTIINNEGIVRGEFFLSDDGKIMPAMRTCTRIDCCI